MWRLREYRLFHPMEFHIWQEQSISVSHQTLKVHFRPKAFPNQPFTERLMKRSEHHRTISDSKHSTLMGRSVERCRFRFSTFSICFAFCPPALFGHGHCRAFSYVVSLGDIKHIKPLDAIKCEVKKLAGSVSGWENQGWSVQSLPRAVEAMDSRTLGLVSEDVF